MFSKQFFQKQIDCRVHPHFFFLTNFLYLNIAKKGGNELSGDAHFLCGVSFEAIVDDSEVDKCTSSPSSVPSLSPTLLPSLLPSTSPSQSPTTFWSQVGVALSFFIVYCSPFVNFSLTIQTCPSDTFVPRS